MAFCQKYDFLLFGKKNIAFGKKKTSPGKSVRRTLRYAVILGTPFGLISHTIQVDSNMEPLMSFEGYKIIEDANKSRSLLDDFYKSMGFTIAESPDVKDSEPKTKSQASVISNKKDKVGA